MYFLAGSSTPVRLCDVVMVVDMDGLVTMPDTADFLRHAERAHITELAGENLPKCAVVVRSPRKRARGSRSRVKRGKRGERLIFSTTSAAALKRRSTLRSGGIF